MRVGQRFLRRERLGTNDEQGFFGIELARGFDEIRAIDVGDEAEAQLALAVMTQRFVSHHRTEIRAADADIDDVADRPPGVPAPVAAADLVGEGRHPFEDRVHPGTTSTPSTSIRSFAGARSATWSTARCSVTLILAPLNIASMRSARRHSSASRSSSAIVSSVTRFFE